MSKTRTPGRSPSQRSPHSQSQPVCAPAVDPTVAIAGACQGGLVTAVGPDATVRVRVGLRGEVQARRAASCLLVPAVGDTVACLRTGPSELWVLAVLQRDAAQPAVLRCDGALHLEAARLQLDADQLELRGRRTQLVADEVEVAARQFRLCAGTIKFVGSVLSSVMDRVTHFSRHYLRTTQGTDRVQAMHIDHEAQQLMQLKAEHVMVNGGKLVKTRGAQIHFG